MPLLGNSADLRPLSEGLPGCDTYLEGQLIVGEFTNLEQINIPEDEYDEVGRPIYRTKYQGQNVVVKFSRGNKEKMLIEAKYLKILSDLGIGPKFFGVSKVDGKDAMIMEEVPNLTLIKAGEALNTKNIKIPKIQIQKLKNQIENIFKLLDQRQIFAWDFQFLITPDYRIVIIDPELYISYEETKSLLSRDDHRTPSDVNRETIFSAVATIVRDALE